MLFKKLAIFGIACVLIVAFGMIQGCSESENPVESVVTQDAEGVPDTAVEQNFAVRYVGTESLDEMLANYHTLQDSGIVPKLSPVEEQEMIDTFLTRKQGRAMLATASQTVIAYTAYYFWSGHDTDLKLEYKWWAGSRQGYYFSTPNWALYWAIRICYGGNISSWTWMEGGYQRVSGVVGSCLYKPFGSVYIRYYLRITTY